MTKLHALLLGSALFYFCSPADAVNPPALIESQDKIYRITNGQILVPVGDSAYRLMRPDLRSDAEKDSPPLPLNFQSKFFEYEGLQKFPVINIFSMSRGEIAQIKSSDLKFDQPYWGESSGVLENVYVSIVPSQPICGDRDCFAIISAQIPFKSADFKGVTFTDPPKTIRADAFGIKEADFGAVRLHYSKRPNGAELVVAQTYKQDPDVNCGAGGIATQDTGYVRAPGGQWQQAYSKFGEMETADLTKANISKLNRPQASAGIPTIGDEVIAIESIFIFLDKASVSMTPIREPNNGTCGC